MTRQPQESSNDGEGVQVRLRRTLDAVPAYRPGKPAAARDGLQAYKISSNENPYPPLPSVLVEVTDAASQLNRYPDMGVTALTERIARELDVAPEQIATGTGSVGVLAQLLQITCDPGDEVVYAWRSFEAYPIVIALAGAVSVQVPLDGGARHDLTAMAEAITDRTRLVLVCTPNNPTGPAVGAAELEDFLARVPPTVLVVVDEAYLEFGRDQDAVRGLDVAAAHPNVAVLRTFSKAYGLAGLRVGYAVAAPRIAEALRKAATPFGVSEIAQRAAVASLDASAELFERVDALVVERDRVVRALAEQGWQLPVTQANFVWFPVGDDAMAFAQAADEAGLTVRPFPGDGVRATIAEGEANDALIQVAAAFRDR
ncbi:MAG: histidinol-phosphate transaminase [Allobranchiibius sp.]